MNTTAVEVNLSANPDVGNHPFLSEYAKKLELRVREHYLERISAIGIDPVLIESKNFQPDCLPPVESLDLPFYGIWFWRRASTRNNSLRLSEAWKPTIRWFRDL